MRNADGGQKDRSEPFRRKIERDGTQNTKNIILNDHCIRFTELSSIYEKLAHAMLYDHAWIGCIDLAVHKTSDAYKE